MIKFCKKKLPDNGELFLFVLLSIIHFTMIIFIYYKTKFVFLLIFEISYFIYFNKKKHLKILFKVILISAIIFLINLFFTEGKIIFHYGIIKITSQGLESSIKRSGMLFLLFLFTLNNFDSRKDRILNLIRKKENNGLILNSINYFFIFWEVFTKNSFSKRFIMRIAKMYKVEKFGIEFDYSNEKIIDLKYYIYNFVFCCFFIIIFFLKLDI